MMNTSITHQERDAIVAAFQFQTIMEIECMHCRKIYGFKDGLGVTGMTSGICSKCKVEGKSYIKEIHYA
jgi:hypothetical protein